MGRIAAASAAFVSHVAMVEDILCRHHDALWWVGKMDPAPGEVTLRVHEGTLLDEGVNAMLPLTIVVLLRGAAHPPDRI